MADAYLWIKAVHVIFVIFWMAGMFMLPRFFAYHVECDPGSDEEARWIDREAKLMKIIINPAMGLTWILGLWLAIDGGHFSGAGWLHAKLLLVVLMSGLQGFLSAERKRLAAGLRKRTSKAYRMINEIPGVLIIVIVILVIVKPF